MKSSPQAKAVRFDWIWLLAAVLWTAGVLMLALQPNAKSSWWMKTLGDKVVHGAAFTVGAFVWIMALRSRIRMGRFLSIFAGAAAAVAVGGAIELLQFYTPSRKPELGDFIADVLGVLPVVAYLVLRERYRPARNLWTA